jgi:hypothetical protein
VAISPPIADHDVIRSQSDSCRHREGQFDYTAAGRHFAPFPPIIVKPPQ